MGDFLSTVSSQIQRVINEAINDQILSQIQATLRSGRGRMPERRWEVPAGRQGFSSEELQQRKGHMRETQNEKDSQKGKPTQKKVYPECGTCGKNNYPEERCWQGAGAHLKPKHDRPVRTPKHKKHNTTPHRLVPSPHQRRTVQNTNFATTPTQRHYISPTICHI